MLIFEVELLNTEAQAAQGGVTEEGAGAAQGQGQQQQQGEQKPPQE
jgi:hypothetical protein